MSTGVARPSSPTAISPPGPPVTDEVVSSSSSLVPATVPVPPPPSDSFVGGDFLFEDILNLQRDKRKPKRLALSQLSNRATSPTVDLLPSLGAEIKTRGGSLHSLLLLCKNDTRSVCVCVFVCVCCIAAHAVSRGHGSKVQITWSVLNFLPLSLCSSRDTRQILCFLVTVCRMECYATTTKLQPYRAMVAELSPPPLNIYNIYICVCVCVLVNLVIIHNVSVCHG